MALHLTFLDSRLLLSLAAAVLGSEAVQAHERIAIGGFSIDAREVSIGQFAAYAERLGLVTHAERNGGGFEFVGGWQRRNGWSFRTPFGEQAAVSEPAVHITWDEARSYCENHGGRLPTRDEWSRAAYLEGRAAPPEGLETGRRYRYPVGDRPTGMNVNGPDDPWPRHAAVDEGEPGINGLYHMGGNVWEWLSNREGDAALTAGGSWWYGSEQTTENAMQWKPAAFYAVYVGFRCAYGG